MQEDAAQRAAAGGARHAAGTPLMRPEFLGACAQELWCKKMPPNAQLPGGVRMQRLAREAAASRAPRPPAAELAPRLRTADALGRLLQYRQRPVLQEKHELSCTACGRHPVVTLEHKA